MNKAAVIYVRVSTDEQAKGYSLSTQVDACQKYAASTRDILW
jgi:DNA invertase Pin-like site-specific DNA recombinase